MATELLTYNDTNTPVKRLIRDGVSGNYDVVFEMIRIVRDSAKDVRLKTVTAEMLATYGLTSHSPNKALLQAIYDYTVTNVKYIADTAGKTESLKSAYRTLSDKYGDCDDLTILLASLAGALGFENVKIGLARYFATDETYTHVYCIVYDGAKRYALDASLPQPKFASEVRPIDLQEIPVFEAVQGLDGLTGVWTNAKRLGKSLAKSAVGALPQAVNFLPLGFISGSALATGATLINQTASGELSYNATASKIGKQLDRIISELVSGQIALDLAQSQALQFASQLSLVKALPDETSYKAIKESINIKLTFIKNFEAIAMQNGYPIIKLNANAMLAVGAAAGGYGLYKLYEYYKQGK